MYLSDIVDQKGKTIAHFAAYSGNVNIFILLEENGFDLNQKDSKGKTPIYTAVKYNHLSIVRYLIVNRNINKGVNIDSINNGNNNNNNVNNNNDDETDNNNIEDFDDELLAQDLLHVAAKYNSSMSIVNLLLKVTKQIKLFDSDGVSLFSRVIDNSNMEFLLILLESFDQCIDSTGLFPLHHAAAFANNPSMVNLLLDYGADIECASISCPKRKTKQGETPLITACKHGALQGAIALLESDADFDAEDENGQTAFHHVAKRGLVDIAEVLLDYGADPNIYDYSMTTPVDLAYSKKRFEMLEFFKDILIEPHIEQDFEIEFTKRNRKKERLLNANTIDDFN